MPHAARMSPELGRHHGQGALMSETEIARSTSPDYPAGRLYRRDPGIVRRRGGLCTPCTVDTQQKSPCADGLPNVDPRPFIGLLALAVALWSRKNASTPGNGSSGNCATPSHTDRWEEKGFGVGWERCSGSYHE
ncbi:hypothetical protein L226DRAFT_256115 [Lentinus tigrinus ALCF2SS1-7]|uniref:uncharacterized protein n=1 Tax=Lentinus tigrinus ALCF2SS1-7 TaxID=1328758 RepID=UPI0011663E75|nr:hypothetical protein L226DRAFT_256115 [Lentinus tigrinus ALCF2SS1-7]